jgi:hypothetical protein
MPMRAARPTPPLDLEGFLDWEERRHERYELAGGVVRLLRNAAHCQDEAGNPSGSVKRTHGVKAKGLKP